MAGGTRTSARMFWGWGHWEWRQEERRSHQKQQHQTPLPWPHSLSSPWSKPRAWSHWLASGNVCSCNLHVDQLWTTCHCSALSLFQHYWSYPATPIASWSSPASSLSVLGRSSDGPAFGDFLGLLHWPDASLSEDWFSSHGSWSWETTAACRRPSASGTWCSGASQLWAADLLACVAEEVETPLNWLTRNFDLHDRSWGGLRREAMLWRTLYNLWKRKMSCPKALLPLAG